MMQRQAFVVRQPDATWRGLKQHIIEQVEQLRSQLEADHDATKTAELRGRIRALRGILNLEQKAEQAD